MMRFAMCNEFCQGWDINRVFELAARAGYDGVEIAPFTLAASADQVTDTQKQEVRDAAQRHGVAVVGLHWLLAKTTGMHINTADDAVRARTADYFRTLVDLCADLGGDRMILGSPQQRNVADDDTFADAWKRTADFFREVLPAAADRAVTVCLEPLARTETNFIINKNEAVRMIEEVKHPNLKLILDCKAMCDEEEEIPQIIEAAGAQLAHFHANDDNRSYPGSGTLDFGQILGALQKIDYEQYVSIEVFDFTPSPEQIAVDGLACLRRSLAKTQGVA